MSDVAKPGEGGTTPPTPPTPTADPSSQAPEGGTPPAEPTVELSDEQKAYLKGIGIEDLKSPEAIQKIIETSIKQKSSVSKAARELEELKVRLASQGKDTEPTAPTTPPADPATPPQPPTTPPADTGAPTSNGVSDNDLFDLTQMFGQFPELSSEAQDGRIFGELRSLGYFGSGGINKKAIYDHLNARNAQAKELRELREFKEKYSTPNPADNPQYSGQPGLNLNGEMNKEVARAIILQGTSAKRFDEARQFLQKSL